MTTRAAYAFEPLMRIAQLTGPLQVDAVIALGKLKDPARDGHAGRAAAYMPLARFSRRSRRPFACSASTVTSMCRI